MTTTPTCNFHSLSLGQIYVTIGALKTVHPEDRLAALKRHKLCDWGDCSENDWFENEFALDKELHLFSIYHDRNNTKFWVITEADRGSTTILLPNEY